MFLLLLFFLSFRCSDVSTQYYFAVLLYTDANLFPTVFSLNIHIYIYTPIREGVTDWSALAGGKLKSGHNLLAQRSRAPAAVRLAQNPAFLLKDFLAFGGYC